MDADLLVYVVEVRLHDALRYEHAKWWLQSIGSPADTGWLWGMGLDTQRIWGLPVGMTVAAAGSTLVYRKTGNIWLCALLVGTIACMMGVLYGGTRFHYLTYFYS